MKLTKGELNALLLKISEDNPEIALILKLIYIYGKDAVTVLGLKWEDMDFAEGTISLKNHSFPLAGDLRESFNCIESENEYVFLKSDDDVDYLIDVNRKKLRYYLHNKVKKLDLPYKLRHTVLSITELRKLRCQHLLIDGVGLSTIMELYLQGDGTSTQFRRYIEYEKLMQDYIFPCNSMPEIFDGYTDLNILDWDEDENPGFQYMLNNGEIETVVFLGGDGLKFSPDLPSEFKDDIADMYNRGIFRNLDKLKNNEYKVSGDWSIIKL